MRIIEQVKIIKEQTKDILCNKCGQSLKVQFNYCGLIETYVSGNFESPCLGDMNEYRFSLCEHCLNELFNSFKINPQINVENNEPFELIPNIKDEEIIEDLEPLELNDEDIENV